GPVLAQDHHGVAGLQDLTRVDVAGADHRRLAPADDAALPAGPLLWPVQRKGRLALGAQRLLDEAHLAARGAGERQHAVGRLDDLARPALAADDGQAEAAGVFADLGDLG